MKREELKIDQIIKFGNDTFKVTKTDVNNPADYDQGFNAQRMIKSRNEWTQQSHFLKFDNLGRMEIIK